MSLFSAPARRPPLPMAEAMRPRTLDDVIGQTEAKRLLQAFIAQGHMPCLLFWGPPGTGKTTLSRLMASLLGWEGRSLNATSSSVKDIREMAAEAKDIWVQLERRTLLFIDEIHRLNKGRQDVLLPFAEDGTFILAGSTTENPSFAINHALRSRVQLIRLTPLSVEEIAEGLRRAAAKREIDVEDDAIRWISRRVSGDLRAGYTTLESAAIMAAAEEKPVSAELAARCLDKALTGGDRDGDNHYDLASAFQKSLRGSDADAAVYYLGRLLESGEDPRFVARRLLVTAAEDVGNADPRALLIAGEAFAAVERLGMPECRIPLSQAVIYVAGAPKSNEAVAAIAAVTKYLHENPLDPIPTHLRDTHYKGAKDLGHGEGYVYSHNNPEARQTFLPEKLVGTAFVPRGRGQKPSKTAAAIAPEELDRLLDALRDHGAEWFEADLSGLADRLEWPEGKVRQGLNQLVGEKRIAVQRRLRLVAE